MATRTFALALALCAAVAGCATVEKMPVGTVSEEPFGGANVVVTRAAPENPIPAASAALSAAGWFVTASDAASLTTDWRHFDQVGDVRLSVSARGSGELVTRGEYRMRVLGQPLDGPVEMDGRDGSQIRRVWDEMVRAAASIGPVVRYERR